MSYDYPSASAVLKNVAIPERAGQGSTRLKPQYMGVWNRRIMNLEPAWQLSEIMWKKKKKQNQPNKTQEKEKKRQVIL